MGLGGSFDCPNQLPEEVIFSLLEKLREVNICHYGFMVLLCVYKLKLIMQRKCWKFVVVTNLCHCNFWINDSHYKISIF